MFPGRTPPAVDETLLVQNNLVLDPFNGTGTTTAVAWKLHRRFIGIDVSEQYSAQAMKRLNASLEKGRESSIRHQNFFR